MVSPNTNQPNPDRPSHRRETAPSGKNDAESFQNAGGDAQQTTAFSLGDSPKAQSSIADSQTTVAWNPPGSTGEVEASGSEKVARQFRDPSADDPPPLRRFGEYELLQEIARGGMGVVFKARHVKLNRIVALKMILAGGLAHPTDVARFFAEAGAAASLKHPNIVAIHDFSVCEGSHYFTMDFVEGGDLSKATADGPLDSRLAARYALHIAEAVHHAHSHGILHRDLKPANVLLDADGQPRVTDFGLAKPLEGGAQITASGAIVGTPSYLPPEQASGDSAGPASDVYSIGAILYQLLCGRPPFAGARAVDTVMQVLHVEPIAPRFLNRLIELDLETICVKCLQKDPKQRYPTARALADDLNRFLEGRPVQARPVGRLARFWRWRRRNPVVAALAASVVGALGIGAFVSTGLAIHARSQATEAIRQGKRADEKAEAEASASQRARANERQSRQRLARQYVANGAQLMDDGDLIGSLPWFVQALRLESDDPVRQSVHRYRLGAVLAQCPKPVQVWFHSASVSVAMFSPDGERILTAGDDGVARIWALNSDRPLVEFRHDGPIHWAEFSPDGSRVVTASSDKTARIWDSATGQQLGANLVHDGPVRHAMFEPAGRRVATASDDKTARVWNAITGQPETPPLVHSHAVHRMAFSPDGQRLATAAGTKVRANFGAGYSQIWNSLNGAPLCEPLPHDGNVTFVAFSPDGKIVATTSDDFGARLWDGFTGAKLHAPLIHPHFVSQAAFSPDGNRLVTVADDAMARVWNPRAGDSVGTALEHTSEVKWAAFSPDGRYLVTAELFGIVRVWNPATGRPVSSRLRHTGVINHVAFSPDGRRLVTANRDGVAQVWDLAGGEPDATTFVHTGRCGDVAISADGKWGLSGCTEGGAHLVDLENKTLRATLPHPDNVGTVAFSDDSQRIATGCHDGKVRLWNVSDLKLLHEFSHDGPVLKVAFDHRGEHIASCGMDKTARVWNIASGDPVTEPITHSAQVNYVEFDPKGDRVATSAANGEVHVWSVAGGAHLAGPFKHNRSVYTATFSPDGARLVAAAGRPHDDVGGEAIVWDISTGERVTSSLMREHGAQFAVFDRSGKRVLTAGLDDVVRVWDAVTGQPVTPPMHHHADVYRAIYSPDGNRIASASADFAARVWDAADGAPVTPPLRHSFWCLRAMFDPSGRRLLTAGYDRTTRIWELAYDERDEGTLTRLAELLAGQRLHDESGFVTLRLDEFRRAWESLRKEFPDEFVCRDEQVRAWYARESMEALQAQQFYAAVWNAERSLTIDPGDANARLRLAISSAQLSDWEKAADSFTLLVANNQTPIERKHQGALVNLAAGRFDEYRQACKTLLSEASGEGASNRHIVLALEASVLDRKSLDDPAELTSFAEKLLSKTPQGADALRIAGAVALRAGRPDVAVERIREAISVGVGDNELATRLFLSLALIATGSRTEAGTVFADAQPRVLRELDPNSKAAPASRLPWPMRLQLAHLLKELQAQLKE